MQFLPVSALAKYP